MGERNIGWSSLFAAISLISILLLTSCQTPLDNAQGDLGQNTSETTLADEEEAPSALELASAFLSTKTTGEYGLGCGPPDDFDCGVNRYSGYLSLVNLEAYRLTGETTYLADAVSFAMTKQAQGVEAPDWCIDCLCNPPDDFDCGTGEVQGEMIQAFAELYVETGEIRFLSYARRFAELIPDSPAKGCEGCTCGPPDDFDCGETFVQSNMLKAYSALYEATLDEIYLDYAGGLGDAWMDHTLENRGPSLVTLYWGIYNVTGEERFKNHVLELGRDVMQAVCGEGSRSAREGPFHDFDDSAHVRALMIYSIASGESGALDCAEQLIQTSIDCPDRICQNAIQQSFMIDLNVALYELTGKEDYLDMAWEFADLENIESVRTQTFGYITQCVDFDCEDAEDNTFLGSAFLKLAEATGEVGPTSSS